MSTLIPRKVDLETEFDGLMSLSIPLSDSASLTVAEIQTLVAWGPATFCGRVVRWTRSVKRLFQQGTWLTPHVNAPWMERLRQDEKVREAVWDRLNTLGKMVLDMSTAAMEPFYSLEGRFRGLDRKLEIADGVREVSKVWHHQMEDLEKGIEFLLKRRSALIDVEEVMERIRSLPFSAVMEYEGVWRELILTFLTNKIGEQVDNNPARSGLYSDDFNGEFTNYLCDRIEADDGLTWLALAEFAKMDPEPPHQTSTETHLTSEQLERVGLKEMAERRFALYVLLSQLSAVANRICCEKRTTVRCLEDENSEWNAVYHGDHPTSPTRVRFAASPEVIRFNRHRPVKFR